MEKGKHQEENTVPYQKDLSWFGKLSGRFWQFLGLPGPRGGQKRIPRLILIKMGGFSASGDPFRGDVLFRKAAPKPKQDMKKATPYEKTEHPENFM